MEQLHIVLVEKPPDDCEPVLSEWKTREAFSLSVWVEVDVLPAVSHECLKTAVNGETTRRYERDLADV